MNILEMKKQKTSYDWLHKPHLTLDPYFPRETFSHHGTQPSTSMNCEATRFFPPVLPCPHFLNQNQSNTTRNKACLPGEGGVDLAGVDLVKAPPLHYHRTNLVTAADLVVALLHDLLRGRVARRVHGLLVGFVRRDSRQVVRGACAHDNAKQLSFDEWPSI